MVLGRTFSEYLFLINCICLFCKYLFKFLFYINTYGYVFKLNTFINLFFINIYTYMYVLKLVIYKRHGHVQVRGVVRLSIYFADGNCVFNVYV